MQQPATHFVHALRQPLAHGLGVVVCMIAFAAHAWDAISLGDDKSVSFSLGFRTSYISADKGILDGTDRSTDFSLESLRLFTDASLNSYLKGTINLAKAVDNSLQVTDAIARFEFSDQFNVWAGRMLTPTDRGGLDSPDYLNTWDFPMASQYPSKFDGRDDGMTVWGKLADNKLVYALGAYQGHNRIQGGSNQRGNLLYAGRLQYDFWEAETSPAYYSSGSYYGEIDVLALGVTRQYQRNGIGSSTLKGDYSAWSVDVLLEKKLGIGVLTLQGEYYAYNTSGIIDVASGFNGATAIDNVGGLTQGKATLASVAYLFPATVGWGKLQPLYRYQKFDADITGISTKQNDFGVNYLINGHNALVSATYSIKRVSKQDNASIFVLGFELQY